MLGTGREMADWIWIERKMEGFFEGLWGRRLGDWRNS